ncbi:MAG: FAD-dependent oxidoreductase [Lachnospiraceae bacterium]|nr:FAD-dependent oxidoreductase [Lachnospiraceae bacterium]
MRAKQLREHFYWTGVLDEQLRVFDIIMYTEFGTTYNSYVLQAGDKLILFETVKAKFFEEYVEKLKEVADVTAIDYLVVSHTEPDHAGSVERLLEYSPQMKILATGCALGFLKEIVNRDFVGIGVRDNQEMQIGNKTLRFLRVPNLHWPDTMYTFIEEEQILVTCDSFGAHYCLPGILSDKIQREEEYQQALKYYFDHIIGPFKPFMRRALDKIQNLDITMICTGHGPVLTGDRVCQVMEQYRQWCQVPKAREKKTVIIPYVSAYGYTGQLAERIAAGIRDSGQVEVSVYDLVEADLAQVRQELLLADGILLGTPTIVGEALRPVWELTLGMFSATHGGKYAGAFGSYGWSGEGVPHMIQRLKQLNMKVSEGFQVRFKPDEADLVSAYEYGFQFGCRVQEKEAVRPPKKQGGRELVKCLVCGEIFDASMEVCPVCGVGREHFVAVEAQESDFVRDTREVYVILGNGAAGFYAAQAIRERDRTGSVVLISQEPYGAYNRPMLTKALVAGLSPEQIAIAGEDWYEEKKILQVLGKRVEQVDIERRQVRLSDESLVPYTRLIYALGSESFVPPIPGAELPGVSVIRSLADAQRVEALMKKAKYGVVIGGGVLGLETAWEMKKAGLNVTILEAAPVLMGRQLDSGSAQRLVELIGKQGIEIRTGVNVAAIEGENQASSVRLTDGTSFPAELVVISAGVRPRTELARQMGLVVQRGVVVNNHMETSVPQIYACGDCAEYQGISYGVWPQALDQGRTAGANAAGEALEYTLKEPALTFHGMNTALFAAGDAGKNPDLLYKTVELQDMGKGRYEKYYFRNNRLCGVILLGDLGKMARLTELLDTHASYEQVMELYRVS